MLKEKSWKGRLISAIDFSLSNTNYKEEFILYVNQFGYDVNWQNTRKYITYTTPEGMKCRNNKLHEEKYLKEKWRNFMELKEMNQLPIVQLMNMKMEEQAKKQIYLEELTQKLEKLEQSMVSTMENI